jgi:phospholipid-binding lipoprotein MlaA
MSARSLPLRGAVIAAVLLVGGCAHLPADEPADPLEPFNRAMFSFNRTADKYVMRPVAKGYVKVVPDVARTGVTNFFANAFYPTTIVNDALQGKPMQFLKDFARLLLNTTVGLGGLIDVAREVGLPRNNEDFGQTLGVWGFGEGWFLMLPLLGPSNNRDLVGRGGDYFTSPLTWMDENWIRYTINGVSLIDLRAGLLGTDKFLDEQFDPYIAIRTAYLMRRQSLVYDGNPPPEKYDLGEDEPLE